MEWLEYFKGPWFWLELAILAFAVRELIELRRYKRSVAEEAKMNHPKT
jgi:hypothetical protein